MQPPFQPPQPPAAPAPLAPPATPQPVLAPAPAPKHDKDDKKIDVNFWELSIDKTIDFVLIFVGLWAALAVQDCTDAKKEKAEYVKLLGLFKTELVANQGQKSDIEKDIGPIAEVEPPKVLGPMQTAIDDFRKEATEAEQLLNCLALVLDLAARAPTEAEQAKVAACTPLLEKAQQADTKEAAEPAWKPVSLTPFYRRDVLTIYLAGGVKTFKNTELAVEITKTYNSTNRIEELVREIEDLYNGEFMKIAGEVRVLEAELNEAAPQGDPTPAELVQLRAQVAKSASDVRKLRYDMERLQGKLDLKARRLKDKVAQMDKDITEVAEKISAEEANPKD